MRFPKAHEGVKLLLIAWSLTLIAAAMQLGNALAAMLPDTGSTFFLILRGVSFLGDVVAGAASIANLVLLIVGMARAKADEPSFGTALVFFVISCVVTLMLAFIMLALMILGADFTADPPVIPPISAGFTGAIAIAGSVLSCCMMLFIASGIVRLAQKLGDGTMAAYGRRYQRVIAALYGANAVVGAVSIYVRRGGPGYFYDWTTGLSSLVSCALSVVTIGFLSKAKNMLAR